MKKNARFYLCVITILLASPLHAESYEDGQAAFDAKDYYEAVEIWESLAEQGDLTSQLRMAELFSTGLIVKMKEILKMDKTAVFNLYSQAADQGSSEALLQLGLIYMYGQEDVKQDTQKARELYLKAAKQGYAKAQYYYGVSYFRGQGVTTDYVQAHAWMNVAAIRGYEPAKDYSEQIEEVLSEENLKKSKSISDQLMAEIE